MASEMIQVLKVRNWLIWSDVNGVCKRSNLLRRDDLTERRLRRQEKLNSACWEAHLISYPNRTKKARILLEDRRGSEMMSLDEKG